MTTSPNPIITPTTIASSPDVCLGGLALDKAEQKFLNYGKPTLVMYPVKLGPLSVKVTLDGEFTTEGILVNSEFNTHSFGFEFTNEDDLTALSLIEQKLLAIFPDYTLKPIVKDDKIYLKLKFTDNKAKYTCTSNIKLNPKNPSAAPIYRYQKVIVLAQLTAYFHLEDKTCGLTFRIQDLQIAE